MLTQRDVAGARLAGCWLRRSFPQGVNRSPKGANRSPFKGVLLKVKVLLKVLIRLLKARLKVLPKVLLRLLNARLKVLLNPKDLLINLSHRGQFQSYRPQNQVPSTVF